MAMTFDEAARAQYRRHPIYTVWLVGPAGEREQIGATQRKSGDGLLKVIARESVQERMRRFPDAESLRCAKRKGGLELTNGWRVEFGGTIRQEAD